MGRNWCLYPHFVGEGNGVQSRTDFPKASYEASDLELSKMELRVPLLEGSGFLDFHGFLLLYFQITGQAHASLWSATRCARDSSAGLSAPRPSAAPPWAEPGATPARCALPSPTPAAAASFPTSAQEPVKVNPRLVGLWMDSSYFLWRAILQQCWREWKSSIRDITSWFRWWHDIQLRREKHGPPWIFLASSFSLGPQRCFPEVLWF